MDLCKKQKCSKNKINKIKTKMYSPSDVKSAGYWQCSIFKNCTIRSHTDLSFSQATISTMSLDPFAAY